MHDFKAFAYLDVEKTGSSFIKNVLKDVSALPLLYSIKHAALEESSQSVYSFEKFLNYLPSFALKNKAFLQNYSNHLGGKYRKNCYYFNSIREPFEYYVSLYNFGCDGKGGLANNLRYSGYDYLYNKSEDGFLTWLSFILDGKNAKFMDEGYAKTCCDAVGFLTYRFLRLSIVNPMRKLPNISSQEDAQQLYETENVCQYTIRKERLNEDMSYLFKTVLQPYVKSNAEQHLQVRKKMNVSISKSATRDALLRSPVADQLLSREAFIVSKFYPDALA